MPGGKLEFKEEPKAGAVRELREETGMETATDHLELISVSNDINGDAHFVTLGFMCHECSGEPLALEPDEITVWEWFPLDALPEHVFPPSLKIIKNYQDGAVYKH
jgi:8-oxo-dGTP diphosphatase